MTDYNRPTLLFNGHLETIYPALLRKVSFMAPVGQRIATDDGDFLDLDWYLNQSSTLVIVSHGLEGNSLRPYVRGMCKAFWKTGMDALAWNYRGCGPEMNRTLRFYHSGATDDLHRVVQHALSTARYKRIFLVGFSLGGNLTLKYLGEQSALPEVRGAAVFSVPLELHASCRRISERENRIYAARFLKSLKKKVTLKSRAMSGLDIGGIDKINTLIEFDDRYTAPLHGFRDAADYYRRCSSLYFLEDIKVPTLIVNAANDPFLSKECYPRLQNRSVCAEYPRKGGHVGFALLGAEGLYWSELRAIEFCKHSG